MTGQGSYIKTSSGKAAAMMRQELKGMGAATARVWRKRKNPPQRLECECGLIPGRLTKWIVGKGIRGNRSQSMRDYLEGLEQRQIASILCYTASSTMGTAYVSTDLFQPLPHEGVGLNQRARVI